MVAKTRPGRLKTKPARSKQQSKRAKTRPGRLKTKPARSKQQSKRAVKTTAKILVWF